MTPSPGIEPGPHWWEASALPLRQHKPQSEAKRRDENTQRGDSTDLGPQFHALHSSLRKLQC